jgi:D-3-phosphoglycerate dehydrogenase
VSSDERQPTGSPTVLVTSRSFGTGSVDLRAALEAAGLTVVAAGPQHDLGALRPALAEAVAWIAGTGPVSAEHLAAAPRLRIVARYGVGVEAVDLPAAEARGIVVTNTPGANSEAVADHAVALILAALRRIVAGDRAARKHDFAVWRTRELGSLTVGIVGLGRIGRGVARRLSGFDPVLLGCDPWVSADDAARAGIQLVSADELRSRCDVITLHAPGDAPLVDQPWLAASRPGLLLVNTARASLVDEAALASALRDGRVAAYATDVLSGEGTTGEPSPLVAEDLADRTIITPHWAAQTVEAVDQMGAAATAAVLAVLRGEPPEHIVVGGQTTGGLRS